MSSNFIVEKAIDSVLPKQTHQFAMIYIEGLIYHINRRYRVRSLGRIVINHEITIVINWNLSYLEKSNQ